jgi:cobyrinic acid a,c-diamide synthase
LQYSAKQAESKIQNPKSKIRLAIAYDSAFNFYYADNLELLEQLGAELCYWSPLHETLPEKVQGLYFGGGFPEVFAAELAQNQAARLAVKGAIASGMPTYAECGGLMYLCEQLADFEGKTYPMVGILPTTAAMGKRLTLGYRHATALQDTVLMKQGYQLQGYASQLSFPPEGWQRYQVHASYTHVHFGAQPQFLDRFLQHCAQFKPLAHHFS